MSASREGCSQEDFDNFKVQFKFYKRRQPPPDMSNVLDFDELGKVMSAKPSKVSIIIIVEVVVSSSNNINNNNNIKYL